MKNIELLVKCNDSYEKNKINFGKGCYIYKHNDKYFNLNSIEAIIKYICNIKNNTIHNLPIKIIIKKAITEDKISLIMLECICYYMIKEINKSVLIELEVAKYPHNTILATSPLKLLTILNLNNKRLYIKKFEKSISMYHYRALVKNSEAEGSDVLSKEQTNIALFLQNNNIKEYIRENLAEVVVELIDNACSHGDTDCIVDIDVSPNVGKQDETDEFYAINICVLNFSYKLFNEDLRLKLKSEECQRKQKGRYKQILDVFKTHKINFSDQYTEDDFYTIAAYQHNVSGRKGKYSNGGTGMTKLIKNLQQQSVVSHCFMISGNRIMRFKKELLDYDENYWLGFNKEKDFFAHIPDEMLFCKSKFYMPGTGYNLYFIFKKEVNQNGK